MGEVLPREFPIHEVQSAGLIVRNYPLGSLPLHTCQIKVHGNMGPCASWQIVVHLEPLQSPGDYTLPGLPSQSSFIFSLFFSSSPKKKKSQAPKASFSRLSRLFAQGVAGERNGRAWGRPGTVGFGSQTEPQVLCVGSRDSREGEIMGGSLGEP